MEKAWFMLKKKEGGLGYSCLSTQCIHKVYNRAYFEEQRLCVCVHVHTYGYEFSIRCLIE